MRFTRLRLNGFKSFVDPTDLVIAEGLTGVVGPNGCGKSNLLEALRWVMGENRASAMRGDGMEDVIFAGSVSRSARHFAEVVLVIDNADRLAPLAFNDADQIEVTRRITREAGSAYRVQGREVRARDVQMLFADASTGAHSPALVRQGQIAELIAARPQARRRVLEEAAGIAGLYQRRHEAELRLKAAEANLTRVDDVLGQLDQQLAGLARQARAAARYREIGAALRRAEGLLHYRRWHEAQAAEREAQADLRERILAAARAEADAQAAQRDRAAAEATLPSLRDDEVLAGAILQRLRVAVDTLRSESARAVGAIAAIQVRLRELDRDEAREAALSRDADATEERLMVEDRALSAAGAGEAERLTAAAEKAALAAADLQEKEQAQARDTEDAARLAARYQTAERLVQDLRQRCTRSHDETQRAAAAGAAAGLALANAAAALATAQEAESRARATVTLADRTLAEAEAARAAAQTREAQARATAAAAEGEAAAIRAEVQALTRLVQRDSGARQQLVDLVQVAPGYEAALGAALADDLTAPLAAPNRASGWHNLPPLAAPPPLPAGAEPLSRVVSGPAALDRRLGQVGLVPQAEGPRLQPTLTPGQRLVSREGDLWRWDGLRATAADAPSATALRLQQVNRLAALKGVLETAAARAGGARAAHDTLVRELAQAGDQDARARSARREADRQMADAARAAIRAEGDRTLAEGRREAAEADLARHRAEAEAAEAGLAAAEAALAALPPLADVRAKAETARRLAEAARTAMFAARAAQDDVRRDGEARQRRRAEIARERADWAERRAMAGQRAADLADRRKQLVASLTAAQAAPDRLAAEIDRQSGALADADRRATAATEALARATAALAAATAAERAAERVAADLREVRARAEARRDGASEALAQAARRLEEDTQLTPAALLESLAADPGQIPATQALETETAALRRQRDALGAVNLRADEDAATVAAEREGLARDQADLTEAIRALRQGISSLNREGRERLLTAFEQVNANFAQLFKHLFGGGEARLVLVESDDPLDAGLEILCQPPGKKLSTLSLLSGGEQTLTALALIFGVFLANPAPICVLDEVDAPLDDANVVRFCDLLDEMTRRTETRFLVITHHAVTMARMDRLFGVTMAEPGVSQLVSVDLRKAAALVA